MHTVATLFDDDCDEIAYFRQFEQSNQSYVLRSFDYTLKICCLGPN